VLGGDHSTGRGRRSATIEVTAFCLVPVVRRGPRLFSLVASLRQPTVPVGGTNIRHSALSVRVGMGANRG
jgi:hypothetical protein